LPRAKTDEGSSGHAKIPGIRDSPDEGYGAKARMRVLMKLFPQAIINAAPERGNCRQPGKECAVELEAAADMSSRPIAPDAVDPNGVSGAETGTDRAKATPTAIPTRAREAIKAGGRVGVKLQDRKERERR